MEDIHEREVAIESHETKVVEIEAKSLKFEQEGKYQITKDMHEFREQIGFSIGKLAEQQHIDEKHRNMDAIATNMMNVDVELKKR
jgi:DNA-binding FadR family transcriptional regulator